MHWRLHHAAGTHLPCATWGGADGASAVRHREQMSCCWRNFKLGKGWDPSPRPWGDGSLSWLCCSASEPQTQCEFPLPAIPDTAGLYTWQSEGLPNPSGEGLSPSLLLREHPVAAGTSNLRASSIHAPTAVP